MKIEVKGNGNNISIPIPTGLIFSKASVWTWLKIARMSAGKYMPERVNQKADAFFDGLSDEALYALCGELMRIKRKHGSWDLVEVESSDGTRVLIRL